MPKNMKFALETMKKALKYLIAFKNIELLLKTVIEIG